MIDILFLAKNRLEFTKASFDALVRNTNWDNARLVIFEDGSDQDAASWLYKASDQVPGRAFRWGHYGSPVAIMVAYLAQSIGPLSTCPDGSPMTEAAEFFAKIDNDVIVPPGWLDQCLEVMEGYPELGLLGIEPPDSRKPHFSQPMKPQPTRHLEMAAGPAGFVTCDAIGGIGLMRRSAFERRDQMIPHSIYGGFTDWQLRNRDVIRGWIRPSLKLFLLDRLPIEPWKMYSEQYIAKGWQRKWRDYEMSDSHLWEWWVN